MQLVRGKESGCYFHPSFLRGNTELLKEVKRGVVPPCPPHYEKKVYGCGARNAARNGGADGAANGDSDSDPELRPIAKPNAGRQTRGARKKSSSAAAAKAAQLVTSQQLSDTVNGLLIKERAELMQQQTSQWEADAAAIASRDAHAAAAAQAEAQAHILVSASVISMSFACLPK